MVTTFPDAKASTWNTSFSLGEATQTKCTATSTRSNNMLSFEAMNATLEF